MLKASTVMSNDGYSSGKFPKNLQTIENLLTLNKAGVIGINVSIILKEEQSHFYNLIKAPIPCLESERMFIKQLLDS